MSEAELQTILAENEKLSAEVELTKNIIKVSEACAEYVLPSLPPVPPQKHSHACAGEYALL